MTSAPTIQFKSANHLKEMITIRLDPQPWNEGAYIGFAGTLGGMPVDQTRPLKTVEKNATIVKNPHNHSNGFGELKEVQSTPRQISIESRTTAVKRKADLDSLGASSTHQRGFETRPKFNTLPTERNLRSRKNVALDAAPAPSTPDEVVLSFPAGLPGAIHITNADLERLNPANFLNDSLIEFALKVWLRDLETSNPEVVDQIHVFSPFFYKRLTQKGSEDPHEGVRNWTKKIDIFQKRYIFVPINEHLHWYLAIIYEPKHILKEPPVDNHKSPPASAPQSRLITAQTISEVDSNSRIIVQPQASLESPGMDVDLNEQELLNNVPKTYIFTLDSLGGPHGNVVKRLSAYLRMEATSRMRVNATGIIEGKTALVPCQTNSFGCGIYLLHFARTFMSDPRKYVNIILSPPESRGDTEREAIWLVDQDLEPQGRQQLRLRIEALSKDWKKARESGEVTMRDDESENEVEFV